MNAAIKKHLINALKEDKRADGRGRETFREVFVETGVTQTAEGSARVKVGDSEVIAGVKLGVGSPFPDRPEEGAIMMNAELLPLSSPDFEAGPPGMKAIELARVVDRGIRESKAIDLKSLMITKGEKVWLVQVDICTVNDDGNLLDASALAVIAALKDTKFPEYENDEINYKKKTDKALEISKIPITVTVFNIGGNLIVDPSVDEEMHADARLTIAMTEDGTICALQKGGEQALSLDEISKMVDIAEAKAKELAKFL